MQAAHNTASIEEELRLLQIQEAIQLSRERFMPFVKYTMPDHEAPNDPTKSAYKDALHHRGIARIIEKVIDAEIPFLILCCPPRHGKSELVSRRLPAFFLGQHPEQEVVVSTYNDDFAEDFGAQVREIMTSPQYKNVFPGTKLTKSGRAKDHLVTTRGGAAYFVGRGGSLTGRGGHILICDDLIKDAKEASSKAIRNQAWDWFTKVAMSRRRGRKLVIMTFTRWHSDDPIGRLTDPENPYYNEKIARRIKIINLPAIADDDDPLGRAPGEALWPDGPDTFDLDFLEEQRLLDPLGFEALYQQRPTMADGILFNRDDIRYYDENNLPPLEELRFYCTSDHAVSTEQRRDFSVLLKFAIDPMDNIYLLDCWWRRQKSDVVVEAMLEMARPGPTAPLIWFAERGQISKSIGPFLKKRMMETKNYFRLVEETPVNDKEQRAQSISARVALGKVFFPRAAPWTERAINEMMAFPNGNHDDFVDALSLIGLGLRFQVGGVGRKTDKSYKPGTLAWIKQQTALAEASQSGNRTFLNG
ncbi:putative phage terminase large subunit-like protein [Labrenzia sp. EL_208]|nr:putative phage terminase large subunit-like protein [Labrenzia sp. EL_132]MBG6227107.1 putative phage terminase large subunit-like protein [Labrenzia sp. EL_208]